MCKVKDLATKFPFETRRQVSATHNLASKIDFLFYNLRFLLILRHFSVGFCGSRSHVCLLCGFCLFSLVCLADDCVLAVELHFERNKMPKTIVKTGF